MFKKISIFFLQNEDINLEAEETELEQLLSNVPSDLSITTKLKCSLIHQFHVEHNFKVKRWENYQLLQCLYQYLLHCWCSLYSMHAIIYLSVFFIRNQGKGYTVPPPPLITKIIKKIIIYKRQQNISIEVKTIIIVHGWQKSPNLPKISCHVKETSVCSIH